VNSKKGGNMKSLKYKLGLNLFSKRAKRKIKNFKTSIAPSKIYYLWEKQNLMKIEMFSIE